MCLHICKHKNGILYEISLVAHIRDVQDGTLAGFGDNEIGNIERYLYHCNDCGSEWRYKATPRTKWLQKIHSQLLAASPAEAATRAAAKIDLVALAEKAIEE